MPHDPSTHNAYMHGWRQQHRAQGLCVECSEPAAPDRILCDHHLRLCRERQAAKQAAMRSRRRAASLCLDCGGAPRPGRTYCQACFERRRCYRNDPLSRAKTNFGGARALVLERDGHRCRICGRTARLAVHHIDERGNTSAVPNHDPANLVTLCRGCHASVTKFLRMATDVEFVISLLRRQPLPHD